MARRPRLPQRTTVHHQVEHTFTFVTSHLARRGRVLEVGCGDGALAHALVQAGYVVTAVDDDDAAVASARALGVDAHFCRWPDWRGGPCDAVLFTRSLHHMHDLDAAVAGACAALAPGGRILVEDFAFADADAATAGWLAAQLRALVAAGSLRPPSGSFPARLCSAADPFAEWVRDHDHVQPLPAMRRALAAQAAILRDEATEYLFRYVAAALGDREAVMATHAAERAFADAEAIRRIGARFVAAPRGPAGR